jgi:SAM-dependent methyltransferase
VAATWKEIWEARKLDPTLDSTLAQLLAADGFDMPFGRVGEQAWADYVSQMAATIGIVPGSTVFEVGCGAGAFLLDLYERGCEVGGLDGSSSLVRIAAQVMPLGKWIHADAGELDPVPVYDFVVASGSFHYFPSLDYAQSVIARMVRKARRGVMLLDIPDLALRDEAVAYRARLAGPEAYARKYVGLDHLYYSRDWMRAALRRGGAIRVEIESQRLDGYPNGAFRYNCFAWREV